MSATRALIEFLKDRKDKTYNLKTDLEYPSFNETKIVSICLDEHNAIVVGLETNGNFTTASKVMERTIFDKISSLSKFRYVSTFPLYS